MPSGCFELQYSVQMTGPQSVYEALGSIESGRTRRRGCRGQSVEAVTTTPTDRMPRNRGPAVWCGDAPDARRGLDRGFIAILPGGAAGRFVDDQPNCCRSQRFRHRLSYYASWPPTRSNNRHSRRCTAPERGSPHRDGRVAPARELLIVDARRAKARESRVGRLWWSGQRSPW